MGEAKPGTGTEYFAVTGWQVEEEFGAKYRVQSPGFFRVDRKGEKWLEMLCLRNGFGKWVRF